MTDEEIHIPIKRVVPIVKTGSVMMPRDDNPSRGNAVVKMLIVAAGIGVLAVINIVFIHAQVQTQTDKLASDNNSNPTVMAESLQDFAKQKALTVDSDGQLVLNGQLKLNGSGQILNSDGTVYTQPATASSTSPAAPTATDVVSPGVLSLQGLSGKLALLSGGGIALNGLTISNTGVTSLHAGTGVSISGLTGSVTVGLPQSIAPGATPTFSGLVLLSALGVGYGGTGALDATGARANLSAAKSGANSDITSLNALATPLSVPQGGTGQANFALGGILVGNGTNGIDLITSSSAGKCLISNNAVAPSFQNCPGSSGSVTTGNPQTTGRLTKFDTINNQIIDSRIEEAGHVITVYGQILGADTSNSTTALLVQDTGASPLLTADTVNMKVTVANLVLSGHFITGGGTPAGVASSNLGVGGSPGPGCSITGTDTIGKITITTGAGSISAGNECTVTLNSAFSGSTPHVLLTPTNSAEAQLQPYANMTGVSTFDLGVATAPVASSSYSFEYFIAQ